MKRLSAQNLAKPLRKRSWPAGSFKKETERAGAVNMGKTHKLKSTAVTVAKYPVELKKPC